MEDESSCTLRVLSVAQAGQGMQVTTTRQTGGGTACVLSPGGLMSAATQAAKAKTTLPDDAVLANGVIGTSKPPKHDEPSCRQRSS